MPSQTIRMVAKATNIEYPNRRNCGSYVVSSVEMACWMVPMIARRGSTVSTSLWLAPGPQGVCGSAEQSRTRFPAVGRDAQPGELHVERGGFRIARALVVDGQLLDHRDQELQ